MGIRALSGSGGIATQKSYEFLRFISDTHKV